MTDQTLEQKAVEIITNLEKLADPAMQLTLQAIQMAAIINAALCVAFLVVAFYGWRWTAQHIFPKYLETNSDFVELAGGAGFAISGVITIVLSTICIVALFSASTWLAMFAPELQLARLLIDKVIG